MEIWAVICTVVGIVVVVPCCTYEQFQKNQQLIIIGSEADKRKQRLTEATKWRVPKRFFGIRDFKAKSGQDSGLKVGLVAALLALKANWFDTLTVKQWEIMMNNDVLMFSATNEETPHEQLLHYR